MALSAVLRADSLLDVRIQTQISLL